MSWQTASASCRTRHNALLLFWWRPRALVCSNCTAWMRFTKHLLLTISLAAWLGALLICPALPATWFIWHSYSKQASTWRKSLGSQLSSQKCHSTVWGSPATLVTAFETPGSQAWAQPLDCQSTLGAPSCQSRLLSASGSLDEFEMNAPSPAEQMVSSISVKRQITKHSNCHFCETT